jgi:Tol biopolymer transport system component
VIEVTDGSTEYVQPVWSPDGSKLAFSKLPSFTGVYIKNADGSGPIREITSVEYSGHEPVWTSDSRGIVIRTRTGVVGQTISYVDIETGQVRASERALHPKPPERNVYGDVTVDVDGETKVLIDSTADLQDKDDYYSDTRPAANDLRLERSKDDSRPWNVVEGDGTRRSEFPYPALLASISPTRDRVALLQAGGNLAVSNLDGSGRVSLGPASADWDWSPDGKLIVFVGGEEDDGYATTASELFVAASGSGSITQLTDTPDVAEMFPRWPPDGLRIAYSTHRMGKICVAVLESSR